MTYAEQQIQRQRAIQSAMMDLARDPRFQMFMSTIGDAREQALDNLTDSAVIQNERASLACIGEIAAYKAILRSYDEAVANAAQRAEETSAPEA